MELKDELLEKEWLEKRKEGIGGSDAAAIMGYSKYKTAVDIWNDKVIGAQDEDIADNFRSYGKKMEPCLVKMFEINFPNYKVTYNKDNNIVKKNDKEFLIATVDALLEEKDTGRNGILEIKTAFITNERSYLEWNNRIPDAYYIQLLHYMNVLDVEFAILNVNMHFGFDTTNPEERVFKLQHYVLERKDYEEDIVKIEQEETEFWNNNVLKKVKPNPKCIV